MKPVSAHKDRKKAVLKNEKGSVLISALFAFFFITAIVIGIASITRNQLYQLYLTQEVYKAKAMMALSEKYISEDSNEIETVLSYDTGTIYIEQEGAENYKMTGHFDNNLTLTEEIFMPNEEGSDQENPHEAQIKKSGEADKNEKKVRDEKQKKKENEKHYESQKLSTPASKE